MPFDFMPKGYIRMNVGTRNNLKLSISSKQRYNSISILIYITLISASNTNLNTSFSKYSISLLYHIQSKDIYLKI